MRHDGPKNLFASLAHKVFKDVEVEPYLEPLTGEVLKLKSANRSDEARSDVRIRGFWGNRKDAFFEFRVFYPFALSYVLLAPDKAFDRVAKQRKREYEERINLVDNGSFTPMIMPSTGGCGQEMSVALKVLAAKLSALTGEAYSKVLGGIRARFAFELARAALICLRGSRSPWHSLSQSAQERQQKISDHMDTPSTLLLAESSDSRAC